MAVRTGATNLGRSTTGPALAAIVELIDEGVVENTHVISKVVLNGSTAGRRGRCGLRLAWGTGIGDVIGQAKPLALVTLVGRAGYLGT